MTAAKVIFAGPSLWGSSLARPDGIAYRAPARRGDILNAIADGARAIGLVDGQFGETASVWHKEILFALESNVHVFGAASMGALRAAECAAFGMRGVGRIYDDFTTGRRWRDADVAVIHADAYLDYQPLTIALVDAEDAIRRAVLAGDIDPDHAKALGAAAAGMHFTERSWQEIGRLAGIAGPRMTALTRHTSCSLKRKDAEVLVQLLANLETLVPQQAKRGWRIARTEFLSALAPETNATIASVLVSPGRPEPLLSDCAGRIEQLVLHFADAAIPFDGMVPDYDLPFANQWLSALDALIRSFPADIEVIILATAAGATALQPWASSLPGTVRLSAAAEPMAGEQKPLHLWAQDCALIRSGGTIVRTKSFRASNLPRSFAEFTGVFPIEDFAHYIHGGDCLVGPDFVLLSIAPVNESVKKTLNSANTVTKAFRALDGREMVFLGVDEIASNPAARERRAQVRDRLNRYFTHRAAKLSDAAVETFTNSLFHIDLCVSVTGVVKDGQRVVLLAEPAAADSDADPLDVILLNEGLDILQRQLTATGFKVIRNPIPLAMEPEPTPTSAPELRFFNNVILEGVPRPGVQRPAVWLPVCPDEPHLAAFDRANADIWCNLGFDVHPVAGWNHLPRAGGAIRCAVKVLRRG